MDRTTLIYGPPFSGQRERLLSLLKERVSSNAGEPVYVLVPTHQAAVSLGRSLVDACESGAAAGVRCGTIANVAGRIYALMGRRERPATDLEREVIVGTILEASQLPRLSRIAGLRGVRRRLAGFVSLVKRNMIGAKDVAAALSRKRSTREWEAELPDFLEAYDNRMQKLSLVDRDDVLSSVAGALQSGEAEIRERSLVAVYGFFHLCPSEFFFVTSLLASAERGILFIDHHPERAAMLQASGGLFEVFRGLAAEEECVERPDDGETPGPRVELEQAFDVQDEANSIARSVKKILLSDPAVAPSSVKIVANDMETYAPVLRETFSRYEIPLSVPAGRRLDESPIVAAALALLEAPIRNFRRQAVLRILSMPFVEVRSGGERLDRETVDRISRASRIIEGYEEWRTRLGQLRDLLATEGEVEPDYPDPVDQEVDLLRKNPGPGGYGDVMAVLLDMLARLKSLSEELPPSEFCTRYMEQLKHFGIVKSAFGVEEPDGKPERLKVEAALALSRFCALLKDLVAALGEYSPSARGLSTYYQMLRSAAASERIDEAEPEHDAVELHWGSQSATIPAEYVFVVGATESGFPGRESSMALHSAEELREMGILTEPRHEAQSRFLFHSYVASAGKRVRLSWPASDLRATFLRSPLVEEIESSAEVLMQRARAPQVPPADGTLADACVWLGELASRGSAKMKTSPPMLAFALHCPKQAEGMLRAFGALDARVSSPGRNPYDGTIAASDLLGVLRSRFAGDCFGVTRLEAYAKCPFRFFAENVLELLPPAEPEEVVSPLNWGSAVHRALARFMSGRLIRSRGKTTFKAVPRPEEDADGFAAAVEELTQILAEELSNLPHRSDDAYYLSMRENLLGAQGYGEEGSFVEAFMREEANREALGFAPAHFEIYFGPSAAPRSADKLLHGPPLLLRGSVSGDRMRVGIMGKIDRLDMVDGSGVVIYDYKSGGSRPPGPGEVRGGTALQPSLYLLAAVEMLRRKGLQGAEPRAAAYLRVRDSRDNAPSFAVRSGPLPGDGPSKRTTGEDDFRESLLESLRFSLSYAHGMVSGLFPPVPKGGDAGCRNCIYGTVCRRDEVELFGAEFPVSAEDVALDSYGVGDVGSRGN